MDVVGEKSRRRCDFVAGVMANQKSFFFFLRLAVSEASVPVSEFLAFSILALAFWPILPEPCKPIYTCTYIQETPTPHHAMRCSTANHAR